MAARPLLDQYLNERIEERDLYVEYVLEAMNFDERADEWALPYTILDPDT